MIPARAAVLGALLCLAAQDPPRILRSPLHVAVSPDGSRAYIVNHTSDSVSVLDLRTRRIVDEFAVGRRPVHAQCSPDGRTLYVTSLHGNTLDVVDLGSRRIVRSIPVGFEPCGVLVSDRIYVVNQISETLTVVDGPTAPLGAAPRYLAKSGDRIVVANGLGRSVTILDRNGTVLETRDLGRASILRQVAANDRYAFVAHLVSHDEQVTSQIERGWIHSNGFSVLDLEKPGHRVTILLDTLLDGAANPWGVALGPDRVYFTLAGVHEVAIVEISAAMEIVNRTTPENVKALEENVEIGIAKRVPTGGIGPRGIALAGDTVLVTNYFSDTVSILDAMSGKLLATVRLGEMPEPTLQRRGEILFNDAGLTHQRWFSCASCHQEDATVDGLNWDLLNDGAGNPKNAKSLHDIHDTPPAMWTRVREDMNAAVAAGQRFAGRLPVAENHRALMAFLENPPRAPNPYRARNPDSRERGRVLFEKSYCSVCHPPSKYTDLKTHKLGFANEDDLHDSFDTPSLRDCYRTAPYLHDGRAKTLEELFRKHNPEDVHGSTRHLSEQEFGDLMEFLRGL